MKVNKKSSRRNMTYLLLILSLIGTQFFMGCRHFHRQYIVDPILVSSKLPPPKDKDNNELPGFYVEIPVSQFPGWKRFRGNIVQIDPNSVAFKALYDAAKDTSDGKKEEEAKKARNELITRMMLLSDGHYQWHKAAKEANKTVFQMTARGTSLFLSGLASAVGGESVKAALAAGSTFGNAISALGNEEIFYKRLVVAIIRKMDEKREMLKGEIEKNMDELVTKYPVNTAIMDVIEYHNAGSFIKGLELVTEQAEASLKEKAYKDSELEITKLTLQIERNTSEIERLVLVGRDPNTYSNEINILRKENDTLIKKRAELRTGKVAEKDTGSQ